MSATDKLMAYINNLTPEQVDKIMNQLPRLISLIEESAPPYPPGQPPQKQ